MVTDGLTGSEKSLKFLGPVYDIIMASGDIFALIVAVSIIIFLVTADIPSHQAVRRDRDEKDIPHGCQLRPHTDPPADDLITWDECNLCACTK